MTGIPTWAGARDFFYSPKCPDWLWGLSWLLSTFLPRV